MRSMPAMLRSTLMAVVCLTPLGACSLPEGQAGAFLQLLLPPILTGGAVAKVVSCPAFPKAPQSVKDKLREAAALDPAAGQYAIDLSRLKDKLAVCAGK